MVEPTSVICHISYRDYIKKGSLAAAISRIHFIMALVGLTFPSWFGWLIGIFLIDKPWGPPRLKSWFSLHNLWSFIVILLQHLMFVDFLRQSSFLQSLGGNILTQELHKLMFFATYFAFWSIRLVFAIKAKKLASLLNQLYFHSERSQKGVWKCAWRKARFVIYLSLFLALLSTVLFNIEYHRRREASSMSSSWFAWAGQIGMGILGATFGYLCTMAATNVAFSFIVSISFHLGIVFCEFCDDLEVLLTTNGIWQAKDFHYLGKAQKKGTTIARISSSQCVLLNKLESIHEMFKTADEIISPLVLVVFVVETFRIVTGAHEILINNLGGLFAVESYTSIIEQLVHITLVLVGHHVKDMMHKSKLRLQRLVTLYTKTSYNEEIFDVAKWTISFEWNLSASGFFDVDRTLLSGIMTTAMTYIVILVQLQISLNSGTHPPDSARENFNGTSF